MKGETVVDDLFVAEGDDILLPETALTATGYTFAGWFDGTGDDAKEYKKENDVYPKLSAGEDLTLFAHWNSNAYRVIYDLGAYGTEVDADGKDVLYGQDFTLDVPKSKNVNQAFVGWYIADKQITNQNGAGLTTWAYTENQTLKAEFAEVLNYKYDETAKTVSVTGAAAGAKYLTEITVLEKYEGNAVSRVAADVFKGLGKITKIRIPDTVTEIDKTAFTGCSALEEVEIYKTGNVAENDATFSSVNGMLLQKKGGAGIVLYFFPVANKGDNGTVTIPEGVNTIGASVFENIRTITKVTVPASVTKIEQLAFSKVLYLEEVEFLAAGDGVQEVGLTIDKEAFYNCRSLTTLTLPARLTDITLFETDKDGIYHHSVFRYCSSLKEINVTGKAVEGVEAKYSSADGYLLSGNGDTLLYCPIAKYDNAESTEIDFGKLPKVTRIGDCAFLGNQSITAIDLPDRISYIGKSAFEGCGSLATINFGKEGNDLEIGEYAFYGIHANEKKDGAPIFNESLTEVTLTARVTKVGAHAFGALRELKTVRADAGKDAKFENGIFTYGYGKGNSSSVIRIYIGAKLGYMDINAVFNDEDGTLTEVNLDSENTNYKKSDGVIYDAAMTEISFFPNGKTEFVMPETLTEIKANLFAGKEIVSITIGKNVTTIGAHAFDGSDIAKVIFEKGGTAPLTIEEGAFADCSGLTSIEFPNRLTKIGDNAFAGCWDRVKDPVTGKWTLLVGLKNVTFEDGNYNDLVIGRMAFYDCDALESIEFPEGTVALGNSVFAGCEALKIVKIPASMQRLGDWLETTGTDGNKTYTFQSLSLFKYQEEGLYGYDYAENLEKIEVAEGNERYGSKDGILYGKYKDENNETTKTNDLVRLYFCPSKVLLTDGTVTLPNTVQEIYTEAFLDNQTVTKIKFETVSGGTAAASITFGTDAFKGADGLTEFALPSGMTTVKKGMFKGCRNLTKIVIPNTVTSIQAGAFEGCSALAAIEFEEGNDETALTLEDGIKEEKRTSYGAPQITYTGVFTGLSKLTTITLPKRLSSIGRYAFAKSSRFTTVDFGENSKVQTIADEAFANSGLTTIKLGKDVIAAEDGSYTYALPEGLKKIGEAAFYTVKFPKKITINIPASVTDYGEVTSGKACKYAVFYSRSSQMKIVFADNNKLKTVHANAFKASQVIEVNFGANSQLEKIGNDAFNACSALTAISIPATVKTIETQAFNNSRKLSAITFETFADGENSGKCSIETIGTKAFANTALTGFTFPETIATYVFANNGNKGLYAELFYGCKFTTRPVFPANITTQDQEAILRGCTIESDASD